MFGPDKEENPNGYRQATLTAAGTCPRHAFRLAHADRAPVGARLWNVDDRRLLTPKSFGWGYTLNVYWLAHPVRYLRAHFDGKGA